MFLQVYNNRIAPLPRGHATSRSPTPRATPTSPIVPAATNQFAYRGGLVPAKASSRTPTRPPPVGRRRARCCSSRSRSSRSTTGRSRSRSSTRRTRPDRLGRARRLAVALVGAPAAPASSTSRATGAAVSPPAPSLTSITPTDDPRVERRGERGEPGVGVARFAVGAAQLSRARFLRRRLRRTPIRLGRACTAVFSSAVPVLPATMTPGIAAEVPVPSRTTPIIRRRTVCATGRSSRGSPGAAGAARRRSAAAGGRRRRSSPRRSPSAAALACTCPWPIAVEPTSSSPWICAPAAACSRPRPGCPASWLKPKRSAIATSRGAPSLTPSGANTELHETANASSSVPPHSSPLALFSLTPSSVAWVA